MMIRILFSLCILFFSTYAAAQYPIEWAKAYGEFSGANDLRKIVNTEDGGYIFTTISIINNGDSDVRVTKINGSGDIEWDYIYGGSTTDIPEDIIQTSDNGYVFVGHSKSSDGDLTENNGGYDIWVAKLDESGELMWQTSFGGNGKEEASEIIEVNDGGLVVTGLSSSSMEFPEISGSSHILVLKLSSLGQIEWHKVYGGNGADSGISIIESTEYGFFLGCISSSTSDEWSENQGEKDSYVLKLNATGEVLWRKRFGASGFDVMEKLKLTSDGGLLMVGYSTSPEIDAILQDDRLGSWLVKLNSEGEEEWESVYFEGQSSRSYDFVETSSGNFVIGGFVSFPENDWSIVSYSQDGQFKSAQTLLPSTDHARLFSMDINNNDEIILGGRLRAEDYDPIIEGEGEALVIKLGLRPVSSPTDNQIIEIRYYPNPTHDFMYFNLKDDKQFESFEIQDLTGTSLLKGSIEDLSNGLNLSHLDAGIYVLNLLSVGRNSAVMITKI